MNCPRCQQPLACGWWCRKCEVTVSRAHYLVALRKIMDERMIRPFWMAVITICCVALAAFVLLNGSRV